MTAADLLTGIILGLTAGTATAVTYVAMPFLRGAFHHLRTRREA